MASISRPFSYLNPLLGLLVILCIGIANPAVAEKSRMYRWVDGDGNVFYSDKVPPEYATQEKAVINEQGLKVDSIEGAKTPEQLAEEKRQAEIAAEQQRIQDEKAAHDRMLLNTFASEDDLIMVRDGKIAALDANIRATKARILGIEKNLEELRASAADMERNGRAVPDKLYEDIKKTRQQIDDNHAYIRARQAEQQALRESFEADLVRYRGLKGKPAAPETAAPAAAAGEPPAPAAAESAAPPR